RDAGAVQRVHELRLARVRIPPSRLHATSLKALAVAAGRDLPVAGLAWQPYLEIVGFGAREADVARTERHPAIRQLEAFEHRFGVTGQLLERCIGIRRAHDLDELDLVELVLANHSTRVPSV